MSDKEIEIYNENADEIKIRPYEHHAKYYETDQMGIIHHSNYIKWMEEARMDLMDQIGLSYKQMEEMEIISPVLSVSCEYHSMVHFDDTVVIETKITRYNGIKMDVEYRMTDKETGELRTTGKSSHCFLNRSGRPISLKRSYPGRAICRRCSLCVRSIIRLRLFCACNRLNFTFNRNNRAGTYMLQRCRTARNVL